MCIMKCSHVFYLIVIVCSISCNGMSSNVSEPQDVEKSKIETKQHGEEQPLNATASADIATPSEKIKTDSILEQNKISERPKVSQSRSNTPSDIQIPVAVIYDTPVAPARNLNHQLRRNRYRKIRRLHEDRQFQSRVDESLAKRYEITTFRPRNVSPNAIAAKVTQKINSTEKIQKRIREKDPVVRILEENNRVYSDKGEFHYNYVSGDGTTAFERGEFKQPEGKPQGSVEGGFSYTDRDGNDFSLSYTADENGYHPVGAHLPTPPPIPPAIARALEYLATKPTEKAVTYSYIDY